MNVVKRAGYVPVTAEMLADCGNFADTTSSLLHRALYPWEYPDRPIRFEIRLFPRWIEWLLDHTTNQEAE